MQVHILSSIIVCSVNGRVFTLFLPATTFTDGHLLVSIGVQRLLVSPCITPSLHVVSRSAVIADLDDSLLFNLSLAQLTLATSNIFSIYSRKAKDIDGREVNFAILDRLPLGLLHLLFRVLDTLFDRGFRLDIRVLKL